ncbi:uncharacterized protein LOC112350931 [Selaginella moellendorffii]|uniref:uncharacterized protein LOC112350931 n=1 Tax=Selaginella moellendorffii TaxID=88036 RepID=UPI000D1D0389|nr:uncharacterized protein LOC112350931 [Selaginella moellendorffii]|eukprot:XP_024543767.1 uncharacterized protein LOC112350931 [Selaginella moellendorffii]
MYSALFAPMARLDRVISGPSTPRRKGPKSKTRRLLVWLQQIPRPCTARAPAPRIRASATKREAVVVVMRTIGFSAKVMKQRLAAGIVYKPMGIREAESGKVVL